MERLQKQRDAAIKQCSNMTKDVLSNHLSSLDSAITAAIERARTSSDNLCTLGQLTFEQHTMKRQLSESKSQLQFEYDELMLKRLPLQSPQIIRGKQLVLRLGVINFVQKSQYLLTHPQQLLT